MRYRAAIPLLIVLLISSSCSRKVIHFTNSEASFQNYSSFTVVNFKAKEGLSPEGETIIQLIYDQIRAQMERREYRRSGDPDLLVRFELISNQRVEVEQYNSSQYSYSPYYPNRYFRTRTYLESALLIEITDRSTKKLVWQASLDLNKYSRKKNDQEILREAVSELFNTYLYRSKSQTPDQSLIID